MHLKVYTEFNCGLTVSTCLNPQRFATEYGTPRPVQLLPAYVPEDHYDPSFDAKRPREKVTTGIKNPLSDADLEELEVIALKF